MSTSQKRIVSNCENCPFAHYGPIFTECKLTEEFEKDEASLFKVCPLKKGPIIVEYDK